MSQDDNPDAGLLRRATRQHLESLVRAGMTHLPRATMSNMSAAEMPAVVPMAAKTSPTEQVMAKKPAVSKSSPTPDSRPATPSSSTSGLLPDADALPGPCLPPAERPAALEVIRGEVAACVRCHELASTRKQTVFGVGNPQARLCFVGEAPGADEDAQGEPFVGRAGQLLTKIIEACTLQREDVYILNVLKCRPPGNRNPLPEEETNCREYLQRQLQVIRPEFICCLGAVASKALLQTTDSMGRLRGQFHRFSGIPVLCTYHPAYLLRNPSAKRQVWEDMQMLMREMGIALR